MSTARSRRVYLTLTREFLTVAKNMTREAIGRNHDAVNASRARVYLSNETIRQSRARIARGNLRRVDAATSRHAA